MSVEIGSMYISIVKLPNGENFARVTTSKEDAELYKQVALSEVATEVDVFEIEHLEVEGEVQIRKAGE
jgi:hypothetical protein